jgi:DNA mismatch repair protein MutL
VGTEVRIEGGHLNRHGPAGSPEGTSILVEQLFYNTPARFKFLKKDSAEAAAIAEPVERLILARPDVSFRLLTNGQELLHSPGNNDLLSAIYAVYGRKQASTCIPVSGQNGPVRISGFIARPEGARNNRSGQTVLVNGRWIRSKTVTAAIDEAYKTRLMKGRFAFTVLRIDLPQELIDVNVHPQKLEIRFWKDGEVFTAVYQSIVASLNEHAGVLPSDSDAGEQQGRATESAEKPFQAITQISFDVSSQHDINAPYSQSMTLNATDYAEQMSGHNDDKMQLNDALQPPIVDSFRLAEPQALIQTGTNMPSSGGRLTEPVQTISAGMLKAADLNEARVIGTLFRTYILLEWSDELIMIDQHAAHERVLFDQLMAQFNANAIPSQALLEPVVVELTPEKAGILEQQLEALLSLGFEIEPFGPNAFVIRSVPIVVDRTDPRLAIEAVVNAFEEDETPLMAEAEARVAARVCKRMAVKAGQILSEEEQRNLLLNLESSQSPRTCPHGRPTMIHLSVNLLERQFGRQGAL